MPGKSTRGWEWPEAEEAALFDDKCSDAWIHGRQHGRARHWGGFVATAAASQGAATSMSFDACGSVTGGEVAGAAGFRGGETEGVEAEVVLVDDGGTQARAGCWAPGAWELRGGTMAGTQGRAAAAHVLRHGRN
ncbi:hypothetical protein TRIUR3_34054 [Triticum urartu]|uniref:Uncharacterized protein n=1 Tax=Triticum urartu TaxID=4572 RepID=M7YQ86_TRIUA|nr:hypothetical protein TRIUR3_34054 [Triticum urartu]